MTPRDALAVIGSPNGKSGAMFLLGALLLTISIFVVQRGGLAASANAATAYLAADVGALRKEALALAEQKKAADEAAPLSSVPAFIDRIGDLADRHDARIGAVVPAPDEDALFEMEVSAGFRELIFFVAALEELDIQVAGFELSHTKLGSGEPLVQARVKIRPRNDAKRLAVPRLAAVRQELANATTRDPFQALIAGDAAGGENRLDLTQSYDLTGISVIEPAGDRIATIDLMDYVVGDLLDGRKLVHVGTDRVFLDVMDGDERSMFVIRLRRPGQTGEFAGSLPNGARR